MPETGSIDPERMLRELLEAGRNVKFGSGVVGKTSRAMWATFAVWFAVICRLNDNFVFDAVMIGAALLVTIFGVWWTRSSQRFAERNPGQALLEGAQLIEYKRFEAQTKGMADSSNPSPRIEDPKAVLTFSSLPELPDA